jgi:uncharacterized membrane protein
MKVSKYFWWSVTVLLSGTILAGIFLAPWLAARSPGISGLIYALYSPFCHQLPLRSYFLAGYKLAVCSRCSGIYAGFFLSTLLYPFWGKKLKNRLETRPALIIILAVPMGIDFLLNLLSLWDSPLFIKNMTGFIWSSCLPFFWFKALQELGRASPPKDSVCKSSP